MTLIQRLIEAAGGITEFCAVTRLKYRTAQNWWLGEREPIEGLPELIEDAIEHRTTCAARERRARSNRNAKRRKSRPAK